MKVLVALNIPKIGIQMLRDEGLEVTVWAHDLPMTNEQLMEASQQHDILLSTTNYKIDGNFLEYNKHLKMISQFATGYDNISLKKGSGTRNPHCQCAQCHGGCHGGYRLWAPVGSIAKDVLYAQDNYR